MAKKIVRRPATASSPKATPKATPKPTLKKPVTTAAAKKVVRTSTTAAKPTATTTKKPTATTTKKPASGPAAGPAWMRSATAALPAASAARFKNLTLANEKAAVAEIKTLRLAPSELPKVMAGLHSAEPAKANVFTRGVVANWRTKEQAVDEGHALFGWAHKAGKTQRLSLIREMNRAKQGIHVVDNISELSKTDARAVMKEYFSEGGRMDDVAEWFRACGEYIRNEGAVGENETDDIFGKIWKGVKKAVGAVVQAVKTVADAIASAAKSLVSVIKDVVSWTAAKLKDLVIGLVKAGKKVAEILGAALQHSASALTKFVRAVMDAGRAVADVVAWAATQAINTVKTTLQALKAAGKAVFQIVQGAIQKGAAIVNAMVKGLIAIGESVKNLVLSVGNAALSAIKLVTDALIKAGKTIFEIINTAIQNTLAAVSKFVQSLVQLGRSVAQILGEVVLKVTPLFLRPVIKGLMDAGRKVGDIMSAAIAKGGEFLKRVTEAVVGFTGKVVDAIAAVAKSTVNAMKVAFDGMVAAGRKFADMIKEVVKFTGTQLRNLVQALYTATKKLGELLVAFAKNTVSAIRTVLEGLFAAGVTLGNAIKAIVTDVVEGFRKGFFQGLIAMGKAAGKIMLEALKFTGAVAALAFSALLEVFGGHRPLTALETKHAKRVFGTSIDLTRIKVAEKSLPSDFINAVNGGRPFTTMYILNFASWKKVEMKTLIHEIAHVWQAVQVGPIYMLEALHAQFKDGADAYKVTNPMLTANNGNLGKFNREQQAVIAEEYWFNVWGTEIYPDRSKAPSSGRNLDTALLKPYAVQFAGKPKATTARVAKAMTAKTGRLGVAVRPSVELKPAAVRGVTMPTRQRKKMILSPA